MDYKPYTYLIGWSKLDKWYYGCQYGKKANPENLWNTYFTSSKSVKLFRKKHGDPDIIQIRKIFLTKDETILWEHNVLLRLKVVSSERWLNKTDNKCIDGSKSAGMSDEARKRLSVLKIGVPLAKETSLKMSSSQTGMKNWNNGIITKRSKTCPGEGFVLGTLYKQSEEQKRQNSIRNTGKKWPGRKQSEESNIKRSNALKGKKHSEEHNIKKSLSKKGKKLSEEKKLELRLKRKPADISGVNNPMYGKKGELSPHKNKRWWTDGNIAVFKDVCPPGFILGRGKIKKH